MKKIPYLFIMALAIQVGCEETNTNPAPPVKVDNSTFVVQPNEQTENDYTINPFDYAPMAAGIEFSLTSKEKETITATVTIKGKQKSPDFTKTYSFKEEVDTQWLPILGLFAKTENTVQVLVKGELAKDTLYYKEHIITLPEIPTQDIGRAKEAVLTGTFEGDEMIFVQYNVAPQATARFVGIVYDNQGNIRWYSKITNAYMHFVLDNQLYVGFKGDKISHLGVYDLLGRKKGEWELKGWEDIHHDIIKNPVGNLVLTVSKDDDSPVEQHIIEWNPNTQQIVNTIDLSESFPNVDDLFPDLPMAQIGGTRVDDVHNNSISHYTKDGGNFYICSAQRAGIVAVDLAGFPQWYFFPKGVQYTDFDNPDSEERLPAKGQFPQADYSINPSFARLLLDPIDESGNPIVDKEVTDKGKVKATINFNYPFRQHGAEVINFDDRSVTLIVLDNALFQGFETDRSDAVSRAACYKIIFDDDGIDESTNSLEDVSEYYGGTVQQLWSTNMDFFSPFLGSSYKTPAGNYIFTYGSIGSTFITVSQTGEYSYTNAMDSDKRSVIIELSTSGQEKGRLSIPSTNVGIGVGAYRAERISL